ncbi:hypothetical protein DCS_01099 [Drechmeria coniospora]|uniref:Uncharacterized protein n=1 Tax=Drechmeria coniospora TaxID=98403 RepID=A0A151GS87_DRECN|nr:hypothetical protein DCS_01099 [Drechmeria coniospora]KYK59965.1 hypothetical protein DCS_01099 [Drechmeria coniospora]ODA78760.1 hypothetical protein RJ55_06143 [Drechmeria coniospora]
MSHKQPLGSPPPQDTSAVARLLAELLPPDLATSVRRHVLDPSSPLRTGARQAGEQAQALLAGLMPHVAPVGDWALRVIADNQGIAGLALLLAVLTVVVVVMNWLRRLVVWWTRLALRLVFWSVVVAVAAWVWNRGVVESLEDALDVGGRVVGYAAVLKDVWLAEYHRYESQQNSGYGGASASTRGRAAR